MNTPNAERNMENLAKPAGLNTNAARDLNVGLEKGERPLRMIDIIRTSRLLDMRPAATLSRECMTCIIAIRDGRTRPAEAGTFWYRSPIVQNTYSRILVCDYHARRALRYWTREA